VLGLAASSPSPWCWVLLGGGDSSYTTSTMSRRTVFKFMRTAPRDYKNSCTDSKLYLDCIPKEDPLSKSGGDETLKVVLVCLLALFLREIV
jgi:hypothetical protein